MEVMEQMAAVAVVLVLLGATLWTLRRRGFAGIGFARRPGKRMECVERLTLGPQQMLYVVRIDDTELLLATSPSGCTVLRNSLPAGQGAGR